MPFVEEAEYVDSEVGSHISGAEVAKVVKILYGGMTLSVDKIHPEFLKALNVVELS